MDGADFEHALIQQLQHAQPLRTGRGKVDFAGDSQTVYPPFFSCGRVSYFTDGMLRCNMECLLSFDVRWCQLKKQRLPIKLLSKSLAQE